MLTLLILAAVVCVANAFVKLPQGIKAGLTPLNGKITPNRGESMDEYRRVSYMTRKRLMLGLFVTLVPFFPVDRLC
jgi:hypothetical protein